MSLSRKFLRELLESEEGQKRIKDIWDEVTHVGMEKAGWGTCTNCNHRVELQVEAYKMREIISFLQFAAAYGVGKPPEEKRVDINVTARRLQDATDDELDAIIEGRVSAELTAGP